MSHYRMEELTKTQLILLALLVSFVTSIATGIATVALMDQAPADVTRVINRVVERTVEKVTPTEQGANVVTTEKTVIVKEEDALTSAIDSISRSVVRLYAGTGVSRTFIGMGTIVDAKGLIVTDGDAVTLGTTYQAILGNGIKVSAEVVGENVAEGVAVLHLSPEEGASLGTLTSIIPTRAPMKLGQTIFTVSGETTKVATGIVTGLSVESNSTTSDIETNINTTDFVTGTPLGNIFGEIVGIARSTNSQRFIPIDVVLSVVDATQKEVSAQVEGEVNEL